MYSGHQEKRTGDQFETSETTMLCVPSPSWASTEGTSSCSTSFRTSTEEGTPPQGWCCCWRCHGGTGTTRSKSTKLCTTPPLPSRWEKIQRKFNMNRPFQSRHHSDYPTDHHHSQLRSTDYPDCCFMAVLSWRRPLGPRISRKLWSNTCERTQSEQKGASWGQLLSKEYWSLAEGDGSEELSRSRERWHSSDCTTRMWVHHETLKSVSLFESWCFRTKITGSGPQIYLGAFLFLWLFVSCFSEFIVEGQLRIWKPGMKPRRRLRKKVRWNTQGYDLTVDFLPAMRCST